MMRSPKRLVVAVRRPDGDIAVREQAWSAIWPAMGCLRWPGVRGAVALAEALHNGTSALLFSAKQLMPTAHPERSEAESRDLVARPESRSFGAAAMVGSS